MEHSAAAKSKLGAYQVRFVAFCYAAMGIALPLSSLMVLRLWGGPFDFTDPVTYLFLSPYIFLAGAFVLPAAFLLRGSPWARYVLTAIAVTSLGKWIYEFSPLTEHSYSILMLLNAVCAYLLIFSKSFRKELDRRSGRTLVWENFPIFVTAIVSAVVIFWAIGTYRSSQWQNEFSSEFALLEECYAAEIQLMKKIQAEMPDELHFRFRSKWIDSYSPVVRSMRFRGLYIWLKGSSHGASVSPSHDFFPESDVGHGGIPLLSSEDNNTMIARRDVEPRYTLVFKQDSPYLTQV